MSVTPAVGMGRWADARDSLASKFQASERSCWNRRVVTSEEGLWPTYVTVCIHMHTWMHMSVHARAHTCYLLSSKLFCNMKLNRWRSSHGPPGGSGGRRLLWQGRFVPICQSFCGIILFSITATYKFLGSFFILFFFFFFGLIRSSCSKMIYT